jgi:hypothetical protein
MLYTCPEHITVPKKSMSGQKEKNQAARRSLTCSQHSMQRSPQTASGFAGSAGASGLISGKACHDFHFLQKFYAGRPCCRPALFGF